MAAEQSTYTQSAPEIWKPIPSTDGLYEASSFGQIRRTGGLVTNVSGRTYTHKGRVLKARVNKLGYWRVNLSVKGIRRDAQNVHRLVLEAFTGPCPVGMEGCHGDGDRSNNHINNLRWDTPVSNMADRSNHGTYRNRNSEKSHCPRGHLLVDPNLVAGKARLGHRKCLACNRAIGFMRWHPELEGALQEVSDRYYAQLILD